MTWWKNGLLLAAGGIAGIVIAALLDDNSSRREDDFDPLDDDDDEYIEKENDGIKLIVAKIRKEAEWAMEECITDEEREEVYKQISESVHEFQARLQKEGDALIEELKERAAEEAEVEFEGGESKTVNEHVNNIRSTIAGLTEALDEALYSVKPDIVQA